MGYPHPVLVDFLFRFAAAAALRWKPPIGALKRAAALGYDVKPVHDSLESVLERLVVMCSSPSNATGSGSDGCCIQCFINFLESPFGA
jgi:hypothetical protein